MFKDVGVDESRLLRLIDRVEISLLVAVDNKLFSNEFDRLGTRRQFIGGAHGSVAYSSANFPRAMTR